MLRFIALASLFAVAAAAQEARDRPSPVRSEAPFVFEAGAIDLGELVARCASHLQRNILIDATEKGAGSRPAVEFNQPVVTDRNGCEEMLQSLLWSRGFAIVPIDEDKGVFEVLSMSGPRAMEIPVRASMRTQEQVLARPKLRQWVVVACPLVHINANIASNCLRPFFAMSAGHNQPTLTVGNSGSTTLLLSGPQDAVAVALQLVRASDVKQGEAQTEQEQHIKALQLQNDQLAARLAEVEARLQRLDRGASKGDTDAAKLPH